MQPISFYLRRVMMVSLSAIVFVASLLFVVPVSTVGAAAPPVTGYVWANLPTAASYTPNLNYQFNSYGLKNTLTRNGVGVYTVRFPGIGVVGGTVHVTAYGSGTEQCKVKSWGVLMTAGTTDLQAVVGCFGLKGAPIDSKFMLTFTAQQAPSTGRMAYLLADQPTTASYTPTPTYSYNSMGSSNVITRTGIGAYTATLGSVGVGSSGGHVQVTAYGESTSRCKVAQWAPVPVWVMFHEQVSVRCFDITGAPADSMFTLTFAVQTSILDAVSGGPETTYLWADQSTVASYTPNLNYQFTNTGYGNTTITRSSVGVYAVHSPSFIGGGDNVQVTATGTGSEFCKIWKWDASGLYVRCFDTHGTLVDTRANVVYSGPYPVIQ